MFYKKPQGLSIKERTYTGISQSWRSGLLLYKLSSTNRLQLPNSGVLTWQLQNWRESTRHQHTTTIFTMQSVISHNTLLSSNLTTTLMVRRAKPGIWCDYCKGRFSNKSLLHEKAASWTVISESPDRKGMQRHYCQSCAIEVSKWTGNTTWELEEQLAYAIGIQELEYNNVQFE